MPGAGQSLAGAKISQNTILRVGQLCSYVYILTFNNRICVRQTVRQRNGDTDTETPVTTPHVVLLIPHICSFHTDVQSYNIPRQ